MQTDSEAAASTVDASTLAEIAARFAAQGGQPGIAWGVVADGQLAASGGCGVRWTGPDGTTGNAAGAGPVPDAGTVFRIASMTKSFTATLILLLRDRGHLRLDDPAADYVPDLRGLRLPSGDCPPVTIRHLLTMTAGFGTDDPWGDRQQGLDPAEFRRLLREGGVRPAWAPGTTFEYSNLGYAVLGQVIETICGTDYAAAVRAQVLDPLGLASTGYRVEEVEPDRLARGYRRDGGAWLELPPDPYGAFAPMGGVFSCVRDLAVWAAGFATAFPARDAAPLPGSADERHPLSRASRREMQLGQVAITAGDDGVVARPDGPASISYGFGLFAEDDPRFGTIVQHSGGYPGYGSQMRWHPATGLGAIVLCNSTYAHAGALASQLLAAAIAARPAAGIVAAGPVPAPGGAWPQTLAAREDVGRLLQAWDDALAARIFSPNVDQDRPLAQRRAAIEQLRERIGPFGPDPARPAECDSPAHCRWWLAGPGGRVRVQLRLAPLREPVIQQLLVPLPPAAGSALATAISQLTAAMAGGATAWPAGLAGASGLDPAGALRQLRLAAAWAGPCAADGYLAGDGTGSATVRLAGESGRAELAVAVDQAGQVERVEVTLLR